MAETWLYVNDEPLDMGADIIPLTRQAQSLADIDAKLGSFTRSFTIPASDKNRRLLESSYTFTANTRFPYRVTKARLVTDGVEMGVGNLIVENNGLMVDTIRLTFYMDSSPFFQQASALNLWDCQLGFLDHFWSYDSIINGRQPKSVSGLPVVYPLLEYGTDPSLFPSTPTTSAVRADRLFPAVHVQDILEGIGRTMGYTFTGKILSTPLTLDRANADKIFSDLIWPFSGGSWKRDTNLKARYTYTVENPTTRVMDFNGAFWGLPRFNGAGQPIGKRDDDGPLPIYPNDPALYGLLVGAQYNADQVTVRVTIRGTITAAAAFTPVFQFGGGPDNLQPKSYGTATIGNSAVTYVGTQGQPTTSNLPLQWDFAPIPAGTYQVEASCDITLGRPHLGWNVVGKTTAGFCTITDSSMRVEYLAAAGTSEEDQEIRFTYPDMVRVWSATSAYKVDDAVTHPGAGGTLYYALQDSTNVTPGTDPTVWFAPSGPFPARPSRSWVPAYTMVPNWTVGKFIKGLAQLFGCFIFVNERTKEVELFQLRDLYANLPKSRDWSKKLVDMERMQWNTRSSYGQRSTLDWTNEDTVGNGPGTYTLNIDDTSLPPQKSIIALPWSATLYVNRWANLVGGGGPFYLGQIKRIDNEGKFSGSDGARLLYITWLQGNLGNLTYKKADGTNLQTVTTNQPVTHFKGPSNSPLTLGFENSYRWHYRWMNYITDDYRMVTAYFNLTGAEVRAVDFREPVYLEQLGGYFFVQKIKDWVPGKPVAVELIKL